MQITQEEQALLTFLKRTKQGKYSEIDRQSLLPDERSETLREEPSFEEEEAYYYSTG
jgi:hypothetical protein